MPHDTLSRVTYTNVTLNQVQLLKDVLDAWKKEVEKKPPLMTVDEAYRQLGLPIGKQHDGAIVRKSFYKLAQMYHPDKNPDGRVSARSRAFLDFRTRKSECKAYRLKISGQV